MNYDPSHAETLLRHLPLQAYFKDPFGIYRAASDAFCRSAGRPCDALIGKSDRELFSPAVARRNETRDAAVLISGEMLISEEEQGDGEHPKVMEVRIAPCRDESGQIIGLVGISLDMTASRRSEAQLQATAAELARKTLHLERINQELQQFAYVVSHDLRAPLRAVSNLATWLEEDLASKFTPRNRKQMDLLRARVERMDELIRGLLDYSRAGLAAREPERVDTSALVREVVNTLSLPPAFVVEVAADMPAVTTDRLQLQQVFANLISNAVKHHDRPDGHVWVSARDLDQQVEFSVTDDGPGIAPAEQQRIFELFQTLKADEYGGIGLALVKKLVVIHGGDIRLESDVGRGASFHFTWSKMPIEGAVLAQGSVQADQVAGDSA